MQNTKLIMIEGIPGSGKSSTAQFISQILRNEGITHKWWYEEVQGHPIYIFHNVQTMQEIVEDLSNGHYKNIIEKALKKWEEFVETVKGSSEIMIVDSCLFGYLTWSLFPYKVPKEEILQYIRDVERIITPLNPLLIYYYQNDIGTALKKICSRRGGETEKNFIRNATESSYGKFNGLNGFEGMVTYWQEYRTITDEIFQCIGCPKISIENSEGNWAQYYREISEFLDFQHTGEDIVQHDFIHLVGSYFSERAGIPDCFVQLEAGKLIVDGLPQVWKKSRLIPLTKNVFEVQSLPFQVKFMEGDWIQFHVTGPTLLSGEVDYIFTKRNQW